MARFGVTIVAALALAAWCSPVAAAGYVPGEDEPACEQGKGIERALGMHGYRVVVSGGDRGPGGRAVKLQVWQNDSDDWVITERLLDDRRTCVVRSGEALHMLY